MRRFSTQVADPMTLDAVRFADDSRLLESITEDQELQRCFQRSEVLKRQSSIRSQLLSHAVRVNPVLLPNLAHAFERLGSQLGEGTTLEAYVFSSPEVNAFVSDTGGHTLIGVSSTAVNLMTGPELDFVIGHEIGHARLGHLDMAVNAVMELGDITERQAMTLRAWQRAAEISADRAGLVMCDSLEVAANALFKTVSGLNVPGSIDPHEFAAQWDHLVEEVIDRGERDQWQLSHPFPSLRMQALCLYWQHRDAETADAEISKLLAVMDHKSHPDGEGDDPFLARFVFWGGLYVALGGGAPDAAAIDRLRGLSPAGTDLDSLLSSGEARPDHCLTLFRDARQNRRAKLTSSELHSILKSLVALAVGPDGPVESRVENLRTIADELGVGNEAVTLFVNKFTSES